MIKYKVYLFANVDNTNDKSKISNYLKLWKKISKRFDLDELVLSEEIFFQKGTIRFYSGIAEVPLNKIISAIKFVMFAPDLFSIIIDRKSDFLEKCNITSLANATIYGNKCCKIDYFSLANFILEHGGVVTRYGTDYMNSEFAFIYRDEFASIFNNIPL